MHWHNCWTGFGRIGPIVPAVFFALGALILWRLFGRQGYRSEPPLRAGPSTDLDSPLEIAKRRYARGEVTKAEFEEMRRTIG